MTDDGGRTKSEIRRPKPEGIPKSEGRAPREMRTPKAEGKTSTPPLVRFSNLSRSVAFFILFSFGIPSGFGLRISGLRILSSFVIYFRIELVQPPVNKSNGGVRASKISVERSLSELSKAFKLKIKFASSGFC